MVDTLYVVNAVQDTLKLVLSTTARTNFWNQYSPLLVAVLIVVISSSIQLIIAYNQRKQDNKKLKADLIFKKKQDWIDDFRTIIYDFSSLLTSYTSKFIIKNFDDESNEQRQEFYNQVENFRIKLTLLTGYENQNIKDINDHALRIMQSYSEKKNESIHIYKVKIEMLAFIVIKETLEEINI